MFRSIRVSAPRRLSRNGRAGLPRRQRRRMPLRSHRRVLRTSRMTRAGMRPRRARARARSDWTRSLIRMKTGLTGRKKSRRATAVRTRNNDDSGKKIIRIRQPRRMILYPDQAAHRRRSLPLQNRDQQPRQRQRHRHPVKRLLRVRRIIPV